MASGKGSGLQTDLQRQEKNWRLEVEGKRVRRQRMVS